WEMLGASNGTDGIAIAETEQPDAILLDAMMPEIDGLQTLAKLRVNPKTKHIPTIFITAKAQASDRRRFYNAGAKGVINKPFDSLTLASQISGFLGW
ncbi:MAG: response regulator, partial [Waterburya sp.]